MADSKKRPLSTNNFSVKISNGSTTIASFFTKCSSLKKTYGTSEYSDGQTNIKYTLPGSVSYADITISKPLRDDDNSLVALLLAANNKPDNFITVDVQPQYKNGTFTTNVGGIISIKYCVVKEVSFTDIEAVGDAVMELVVILSPGAIEGSAGSALWNEPSSTGAA